MNVSKEQMDMLKFLARFNNTIDFMKDEDFKFSLKDFYNACKNKTLIKELEKFRAPLPENENNKQKFMELLLTEIDYTKFFDNGWSALLYFTWKILMTYIEKSIS